MFSDCWFFAMLFIIFLVCSLAKPGRYTNSLYDAASRAFDNGINIMSYDTRYGDIDRPQSPSTTKIIAQRPQAKRTKRQRVSNHISREVASRQKFKCAACGELLTSDWEVDHVIPLHRGGAHDISNFAALHRRCHQMKNSIEQRKRQL